MALWVLFTSSCNCLPCSESFSNGDPRSLQFFFFTFEYQINALFCSSEQWTGTREQQPPREKAKSQKLLAGKVETDLWTGSDKQKSLLLFSKVDRFLRKFQVFFFTKNSKRSKISFKITTINILIYNVFLHSVEKFPLDMIAEKYVYHSSNCSYLVASFSYLIQ